jgi:hypothetical protein
LNCIFIAKLNFFKGITAYFFHLICFMAVMDRRLGLWQASAINMTDMVGIGPFITLPMVIGMMNGPYFLYAWMAGAFLSIVDGMVWRQL